MKQSQRKCLLIGNPNSGKTTLFNKLTGLNKKVGNWAGVTVELQHGNCNITGETIKVIDLPGCYSLVTTSETAIDELITCETLLQSPEATIINVISATQLARDLYLTQQLLERGYKIIIAITCMDLLDKYQAYSRRNNKSEIKFNPELKPDLPTYSRINSTDSAEANGKINGVNASLNQKHDVEANLNPNHEVKNKAFGINYQIDFKKIAQALACPVILLSASDAANDYSYNGTYTDTYNIAGENIDRSNGAYIDTGISALLKAVNSLTHSAIVAPTLAMFPHAASTTSMTVPIPGMSSNTAAASINPGFLLHVLEGDQLLAKAFASATVDLHTTEVYTWLANIGVVSALPTSNGNDKLDVSDKLNITGKLAVHGKINIMDKSAASGQMNAAAKQNVAALDILIASWRHKKITDLLTASTNTRTSLYITNSHYAHGFNAPAPASAHIPSHTTPPHPSAHAAASANYPSGTSSHIHNYIAELPYTQTCTANYPNHRNAFARINYFTRRHMINIINGKLLDKIVLHKIFGLPIFLLIMYSLFTIAMNIGGALQPLFDLTTQAVFIDLPGKLLTAMAAPIWLQLALVTGIGRGLNLVLIFVPILMSMFILLAWLEQSGYIARAAFVVDRLMQMLGLPGKAFVAMIIGFGCNVPAIMSARTVEHQQDRILTILMIPFMSCSARLAIYAVFTAAFFADNAQNIIFSLYLIGIMMAVLTSIVWKKTIINTGNTACIMEFGEYRWPKLTVIWRHAWWRVKSFILKAGSIIIPLCMIISIAGEFKINTNTGLQTPLQILGKKITPIFAPLGVQQDNWQASVGLLTGMLAKEVLVGTLGALYLQDAHSMQNIQVNSVDVGVKDFPITPRETINLAANAAAAKIVTALQVTKNNLLTLTTALFSNPLASITKVQVDFGVLGAIHSKFSSKTSAFAYLLFVLLYSPCVSVVATIMRELNWHWALFSVLWSTMLAYVAAAGFYQISILFGGVDALAANAISVTQRVLMLAIFACLVTLMLRLWVKRMWAKNKLIMADMHAHKLLPTKVNIFM